MYQTKNGEHLNCLMGDSSYECIQSMFGLKLETKSNTHWICISEMVLMTGKETL